MNAVGELLARARKEAGLSQSALAKRLGKPQSLVAKIERGIRRVETTEFVFIAACIGKDPVDLISQLLRADAIRELDDRQQRNQLLQWRCADEEPDQDEHILGDWRIPK